MWAFEGEGASICIQRYSLFDSNVKFLSIVMQESLHNRAPLKAQSSEKEVETDTTEAILLQEGHEEAKPNEYHDMHILEYWKEERKKTKKLWRKEPKGFCHTYFSVRKCFHLCIKL